jgi:homogentisate 1,2-dioxygenase
MYYRRVGDVPPKRHTAHRVDGALAFEELMGQEGFSAASSLLYHRHSPSAIRSIEPVEYRQPVFGPNTPLSPHHLRPRTLEPTTVSDAVLGRRALLGNESVQVAWASATTTSPLYRNAVGDELLYVQSGTATIESVYGRLDVGPGDYVVIPCSTTHSIVVGEPVELLVLQARGHIEVPKRYMTARGQLVEGAPFSERDLRPPTELVYDDTIGDATDVPVYVRTRDGLTKHVHATHPFDVIGWDGCVYPWAFSIHDFEPIVGRIHQPPPVHQTFAGAGFVVCSFVPRLFDFDPNAIKVPYHHANVDSDEVLFYSDGDFMSRAGSGIAQASISLHPAGFIHGPQPGSVERSLGADRTGELAVMVDTFAPLGLTDDARQVSDPDYPWTWAR